MPERCGRPTEPSVDSDDTQLELDRRLSAIEAHLTTVARQLDEISSSLATLAEHVARRELGHDQ